VKRTPFDDLTRIQRKINRMLDEAFAHAEVDSAQSTRPGTWEPALDVVETEDDFVALVELPGLTRDEVELELDGERLILSGQRAAERGGQFQLMERSYGRFRRVFELGPLSESDGIRAEFSDGVLTILIPKLNREPRKIEVE